MTLYHICTNRITHLYRMVKGLSMIDDHRNEGRFLSYQLDLVAPGNKHAWTISRSMCPDRPKSRKFALGLPVEKQRRWRRVGALFRGRDCNFPWISHLSLNDWTLLISFFEDRRIKWYFCSNFFLFFSLWIKLFFAIMVQFLFVSMIQVGS